jgi:hypothetical protein
LPEHDGRELIGFSVKTPIAMA